MRLMLNVIKSKEKHTKKVLQRIHLQRLTERGLGTQEVENIGKRIVKSNSKRDDKIICDIMKRKVNDAINEERNAKVDCYSRRTEYRECIVQGDYGNQEFEELARQIVER